MAEDAPKVRVALIGVGGFGAVHVQSILAAQELGLCQWVAAHDRDPARLQQMAAPSHENRVRCFDKLDDMLDQLAGQAELIGIAVGIPYHADLSIRCIEAGYHVICEKPPAATIQDVDAMIEAAQKCSKSCVIHFQGCWSDVFQQLRQIICAGELGPVRSVRAAARWRRTDTYYARNAWAGQQRLDQRWVLDGTINNPFSHLINAALHLASTDPHKPATPARVQAELYHGRDIPGEDTSCLAIETTQGARIETFFTLCSENPQPAVRMRILAEHATVQFEEGLATIDFNDGRHVVLGPDARDPRRAVYQDTCRFLRTGQPPLRCPIENTRPFMAAVNGAHESSQGTHAIPPAFIRTEQSEGSTAYCLKGIDALIEQGFQTGQLFSQLNAPWAKQTAWFELADYRRFAPNF